MRAARDNVTEKTESKEVSKTKEVADHLGREASAEKAQANEDKAAQDAAGYIENQTRDRQR